tara:strand:- start:413 stop:559 length:147 start_codon:yes stop_codon:yes gene_type:complete
MNGVITLTMKTGAMAQAPITPIFFGNKSTEAVISNINVILFTNPNSQK